MTFRAGCIVIGGIAATLVAIPAALEAQSPDSDKTANHPAVRQAMKRANPFEALGMHGFSIVLVVGDMQPTTGGSDTVPGAAKKALADMRDFLPYKSYRLLDAEWMLCCGGSFGSVSGRVRGPEEQDYSYSLTTNGVSDSKIAVHFAMRETAGAGVTAATNAARLSDTARADYSRQMYEVTRERAEAERQVEELRRKVEVGLVQPSDLASAEQRARAAADRSQELRRMLGSESGPRGSMGNHNIMDSTFSIAVGETVVIGTSRLKGDKALIALLTAAARPSPSKPSPGR